MQRLISRTFASSAVVRRPVPWFVDPTQAPTPTPTLTPTPTPSTPAIELSDDTPVVVRALYEQLRLSPHLDQAALSVGPATLPAPGPALPFTSPRGRRKRGGSSLGESAFDTQGSGLWDWVVTAQVSLFTSTFIQRSISIGKRGNRRPWRHRVRRSARPQNGKSKLVLLSA